MVAQEDVVRIVVASHGKMQNSTETITTKITQRVIHGGANVNYNNTYHIGNDHQHNPLKFDKY